MVEVPVSLGPKRKLHAARSKPAWHAGSKAFRRQPEFPAGTAQARREAAVVSGARVHTHARTHTHTLQRDVFGGLDMVAVQFHVS